MTKKYYLSLFIIIIFTVACKPKIDASNLQSYYKSVEEIKKSLNEDKKNEFTKSLDIITADYDDFDFLASALLKSNIPPLLQKEVDGKNADEIITIGNRLRVKNDSIRIATLSSNAEVYNNSKEVIEKLIISDEKFKKNHYYFLTEDNITFRLKNTTNFPISKIHFHAKLTGENRSVAWNEADFNYSIPNGIEPNESKLFNLTPNLLGDWNQDVNPIGKTKLIIKLTEIERGDNNTSYSIKDFDAKDKSELDSLLKLYPKYIKK